MFSRCYRIGSRWAELRTSNFELIKIVSQALRRNGLDTTAEVDTRILVAQGTDVDLVHRYTDKPPNCAEFRLANSIDYSYAHNERRYYVRSGDLFSGVIDVDSCLAEYMVERPMAPRQALHLLILDPLSLLLPRQGVSIYHGAAIIRNGQASLLFGRSGMGKSTLAFLLSHGMDLQDTKLMADDTIIVDCSSATIGAFPVLSGFGLSDWIVNQYHLDVSTSNILYRGDNKLYLRAVPQQSFDPAPIRCLYFLVREPDMDTELKIVRMTKGDVIRHLLDMQTTIASPYLEERLNLVKQLADQTEAFILKFSTYCNPWSLAKFLEEKGAQTQYGA